jgi:chromosome segregation ATPase|eukprot:COSAG06_NODE_5487_length_3447_cov_2.895759_2_plen_636_part_00
MQQHTSEAREDRAALRAVIETLEASLGKLDEVCKRTEKDTQSDRLALRGMMELVEDTMPIADAHELLEQQKERSASEVAAVNKRCDELGAARQQDLVRLEALEAQQAEAAAERELLRNGLRAQEQQSSEWQVTQVTLQKECTDLAAQVMANQAAAAKALADLESAQKTELDEVVGALDAVGRRQDELGEQLVALALALREEGLQQSTAQAAAMAALVSDVATKMAALERSVEDQADATERAAEATAVAKRVGAEARADATAVRGHADSLASQVRALSADLAAERRAMDQQLATARQSAEAVQNDVVAVRGEMQAAALESAARHTRAEHTTAETIAAIKDQTERAGHSANSSQEAQAASNARVKLETEALGARVDALHADLGKVGAEVAEAGRKMTDSGRQLNLRASAMQEGYDEFAEKIQAHEAKVRKLLLEYTSLAATQDAKLDALNRDTAEVRKEAGSAAAKLESAADLQQKNANDVGEVARNLRAEFDRLATKMQEAEREQLRVVEQRLAEMRQNVDRSEEKRQENFRECEGRCKSTDMEVRSQRAAADRRLAMVEREMAESANAVTDRAQERILESTRVLEHQMKQLETRLLDRISGSGHVAAASTPARQTGLPLAPLALDAGLSGSLGSA